MSKIGGVSAVLALVFSMFSAVFGRATGGSPEKAQRYSVLPVFALFRQKEPAMRFRQLSWCTVVSVLGSWLLPAIALAQAQPRPPTPEEQAAAAAAATTGCAACGLIGVLAVVAIVVLHVAILVWVARDAKARGMDSAVMWMILVIFTGIIGLIIYIFSRPQGNLVRCAHCQNKRLQASAKCPHCGNA
jgi:preprotein translocase subunit Sss1